MQAAPKPGDHRPSGDRCATTIRLRWDQKGCYCCPLVLNAHLKEGEDSTDGTKHQKPAQQAVAGGMDAGSGPFGKEAAAQGSIDRASSSQQSSAQKGQLPAQKQLKYMESWAYKHRIDHRCGSVVMAMDANLAPYEGNQPRTKTKLRKARIM